MCVWLASAACVHVCTIINEGARVTADWEVIEVSYLITKWVFSLSDKPPGTKKQKIFTGKLLS